MTAGRSGLTRLQVVGTCLGWAMLLVACSSGPTRGPVSLTEAFLVDPVTLGFGLPSCGGEPEVVRLEETSSQVRVEVVSTVHPEGDACADNIHVELESPLGDREVVDLGGGGRVPVRDMSG